MRTFARMKQGKILIVDDNPDILFTLKMLLRPLAGQITTLDDPREMLPLLSRVRHDVILLDMNFRHDAVSGREGFAWLEEILKLDAQATVIFITAYGDMEKAVQAIKQGATDFIPKPWDNEKLIATVSAALKQSLDKRKETSAPESSKATKASEEKPTPKPSLDEPVTILGESPAFLSLMRTLRQCSDTDANLLFLGENGTGKDLLARYACQTSSRRDKAYRKIRPLCLQRQNRSDTRGATLPTTTFRIASKPSFSPCTFSDQKRTLTSLQPGCQNAQFRTYSLVTQIRSGFSYRATCPSKNEILKFSL